MNRAEGLLLGVHKKLKVRDLSSVEASMEEVSTLLQSPFTGTLPTNIRTLSLMLDLCQVTLEYTRITVVPLKIDLIWKSSLMLV